MKDQRKLADQFSELSSFIDAEDAKENKELEQSDNLERENIAIREKENDALFKEMGLDRTSGALKKARDRARKRTEETIKKTGSELVKVPDQHLDDAKINSQIQSISNLGGLHSQGSLYHANMTKFGLGEIDGTKKLELGSQNVWCKAWGGGWYGSGSISINADFWFIHYPNTWKYLHIHPYVILHGFYRNIADDEWYNSAFSRTTVQVRVRAYQYYWSGWSNYTVHNLGDDNINRYGRIDRAGHYNHHLNVGPEDPVWALVRVRLYAYARASGSYSEVNFSDGAGNYVDVGHIHFF